jgi:thiol-disulfide isomerase/thioredoxin
MAVIGLSLLPAASWAPVVTLLVSSFGALVAAYLISVQARMGVYCVYCMTFDTVMVVLPFLAAIRLRISAGATGLPIIPPFAWRAAAGGALVLGALAPALVGHCRKPHVPDAILQEMEATPTGRVTIVDFVDFQCPYCRMMHATISPLIARDRDRIRVVRKNVPLTRIHIHADIAARAEVCGEKLSAGGPAADALVERLFTLPEDELVQESIVAAATAVGLDAAAFTTCLDDPATKDRLADDAAAFKSVGGRGLPLLYIGAHRLEGAQDGPAVDAALRQAEATR